MGENERVVTEVLKNFPDWEVLPAMPGWERRGLSQYEDGAKFVRASGEEDWCNGFFVAVLGKKVPVQDGKERKRGRKEETESGEQNDSSEKKKKKKESSKELDTPSLESHDVNETDTA